MNGYFPVQTLVYPGHERTHQGRAAIYPFGESGWWRVKATPFVVGLGHGSESKN
jgi:hypothetical protein